MFVPHRNAVHGGMPIALHGGLGWRSGGLPAVTCIYDMNGDLVYWRRCDDVRISCGTGTFDNCRANGPAMPPRTPTPSKWMAADFMGVCGADVLRLGLVRLWSRH
jgi:hypothetical protein